MGTTSRALDRAVWLTNRTLRELGDEFRERRLGLALSQAHVAAACRISRPYYGRIENGAARSLSLAEVHRIATVLGLAASVRVYPDGVPVRDVGHATRLTGFLALTGARLGTGPRCLFLRSKVDQSVGPGMPSSSAGQRNAPSSSRCEYATFRTSDAALT